MKTIFLEQNTLYYIEIPLFILGMIIAIINTIKNVKKRKFDIESVMTLTFIALLIGNLTVGIWTTNKANILYIPILYFVAIGILEITKKQWIIGAGILVILMILFMNFEYYYYADYAYYAKTVYDEIELPKIIDTLEQEEESKNLEKVIINKYFQQPHIYVLMQNEISPYEFNQTKQIENIRLEGNIISPRIVRCANYYFPLNKQAVENLDFVNKKYVFIIEKSVSEMVNWLEKKNYEKSEYEYYYVLKSER